jgi:acetyl esterase/lipase
MAFAARLIGSLFDRDSGRTERAMRRFKPDGVSARLDVAYGPGKDERLDLFVPGNATEPLPAVVWIHGGGWFSGKKEHASPYVEILASHGFAGVSLDYSIAPGASYPVAINQLNTALAFLEANAGEYGIDSNRFILAGDSAGAQYASQLAVIATNPDYAERLGIVPALAGTQLCGLILNCGIYDVSELHKGRGIGGWGFRVALGAYLGRPDFPGTPAAAEMSTIDFVTSDFPQTWISGGNGDALTATQSLPFAAKLASLRVPITTLFYPRGTRPSVPHEYQFRLHRPDARAALDSTLEFLHRVVRLPTH